jgi:Maltose operon periplasmic protein precursor (MalM)
VTTHFFPVVAACLLLCGLAGCASSPTANKSEVQQHTEAKRAIVKSPSELVPRILNLSAEAKETSFRVDHANDPHGQKIEGDQGTRMHAVLYALPQWTGVPYSVRVTSLVRGQPDAPEVFFPKLLFLNETFLPVRGTTQRDFRLRSNGALGALSATTFVNADNENERYVLLVEEERKSVNDQLAMQSAGSVGTYLVLPWQLKLFEVMWSVASTSREEPVRRLRSSESGVVELSLIPYKPRKLGE